MSNSDTPTFNLEFQFEYVPPVMKRGEHVLLVIQNTKGKYVLGSKHIYPKHISRFVGGGADNQSPIDAATRELSEELGNIEINKSNLHPLAIIKADIHESSTNSHYIFVTHLFHYRLKASDHPVPQSDLDNLVYLDSSQMKSLIDRYSKLPEEIDYSVKGTPFSWASYGAFYGQIHQIGFDLTTN